MIRDHADESRGAGAIMAMETYMEIFSYTFDLTSKRGKSWVKERFPFWGLVTSIRNCFMHSHR